MTWFRLQHLALRQLQNQMESHLTVLDEIA
jgi:hypothetical protein